MKDRTIFKMNNETVYLEILRIVSILFVIFNHTSDYGFMLYTKRVPGSFQFWADLFISVFCKYAVAMFFAISGAVMLSKEDEFLKNLWNRIIKIVITLITFSFIYYLKDMQFDFKEMTWKYFFIKLYSENLRPHLWYLYIYIAYLISVPFLKNMVKGLKDIYFIYMIAIAFIFNGLIPYFEYLILHNEASLNWNISSLWLLSYTVLYPCIGYFLHERVNTDLIKKYILPLWIVNIILILLSCFMTYQKGLVSENDFGSESFFSNFIVVNCIAIFITAKYIFSSIIIPDKFTTIIRYIGKTTFGIYLIHPILIGSWFIHASMSKLHALNLNYMFCAIFICGLLFVESLIITAIISFVPFLRKIIGFK